MREIQTSVLPFHLHRKTVTVPDGITVAEMVKHIISVKIKGFDVVVNIGDDIVPKEMWQCVRPKSMILVGINIVPAGGGGGNTGKMVIGAIVAIAIVAVTAGAAAPAVAGFFTAGSTAATIASAATIAAGSIVASLAYTMIAGVPQQNARTGINSGDNLAESATQFIEGSSNQINRYGVIPVVLGVNRMFPPQAALPFTETSGNEQYSRQLFTYGYGNLEISSLKIGETDINQFTGVQLQHKLSSDLSDGVTLYPIDSFQENLNILLEESEGYSLRTTQQNIDEFEIDITFPRGIVKYLDNGDKSSVSVTLGVEYKLVAASTWTPVGTSEYSAIITNSISEAIRISVRSVLPAQGQYDIRVRRITADSASDRIIDVCNWTALKSFTYGAPVLKEGISGTAMRILATDQLNGIVDRFNAVVSNVILQYNSNLDTWTEAVSSNPAAIYRYVLQSPAFVKRLSNIRIDIDKLEEWSIYCENQGLTYNRVVDYETSIDSLLNDIAAAGMATVQKVHGVYGVIIDNERLTVKGMVTPRNSWGYKGSINYPEIPHALRVEFRNPANGYEIDERVVYSDGYNITNAELFERLQFVSCTNPDLAYYYARRYLASATLQPEIHSFNMDIENLSFNRGDRIVFVNDSILVGIGQGRIKSLIYDDPETPNTVTSFIIDDYINIPTVSNFATRIRHADASGFEYYPLTTSVGETNTLVFTTPVAVADAPGVGSLCAFVEDGSELDLIVKDIVLDKNYNAKISAINYAPERFNAVTGVIPPFNSNVTLPTDVFQPSPPELGGDILSDEGVMLRNSDGSYITRMIISLININITPVTPVVKIRVSGSTTWSKPEILSSSPQRIVLTGLQDSTNYDIHISYQRLTGSMLISQPLQLNGTLFTGAGGNPANVDNFKVSVHAGIGYFEWAANSDIDISHYYLRFSGLTSGATWETSQILAENVITNRVSFPIQIGTYLIKAVDIAGNQSNNATTIISFNSGILVNVVENLSGQPSWEGTKVNVQVEDGSLTLVDTRSIGYYYYPQIDLSDVYESIVSSSLFALPSEFLRVRDVTKVRDVTRIRGVFGTLIRSFDSIRNMGSVRGIAPSLWSVTLQMRKSDNDITWSAWENLVTGNHIFRYIEFRLILQSFNENITPKVTIANISVDMPDRYESGEDIECPVSGATLTYVVAFKNNPSVNITLQDGDADDKIEFVSKTNTGFIMKIHNATEGGYVARSFDFISAGYGRLS